MNRNHVQILNINTIKNEFLTIILDMKHANKRGFLITFIEYYEDNIQILIDVHE